MGAEARARSAEQAERMAAFQEQIKSAIPPHRHQLVDAYGRPIVVGGTYAYSQSFPTPVTVVDVRENLHPGAPPGAYIVTLMAQLTVQAMSRAPIRNLILLDGGPAMYGGEGSAEERPQEEAASTPAAPSSIILTDLKKKE